MFPFQLIILLLVFLGMCTSYPELGKREAEPGYDHGYGHHGFYGKREAFAQPILYLEYRFRSSYDEEHNIR